MSDNVRAKIALLQDLYDAMTPDQQKAWLEAQTARLGVPVYVWTNEPPDLADWISSEPCQAEHEGHRCTRRANGHEVHLANQRSFRRMDRYQRVKMRAWEIHQAKGHEPMSLNTGEECHLEADAEIPQDA